MPTFYAPPDVHEAAEAWGANCGPGAIAALTRRPLESLRPILVTAGWPGFTNPTMAKRLLWDLGWDRREVEVPMHAGLAWVQFCGGWEANNRAAYKYTHWVAYRGFDPGNGWQLAAYDVNAGDAGGWVLFREWERDIAPGLLPPKSTGWRVRKWIEAAPGNETMLAMAEGAAA